jgi:hypothetical protein
VFGLVFHLTKVKGRVQAGRIGGLLDSTEKLSAQVEGGGGSPRLALQWHGAELSLDLAMICM